MFIFSQEIKHFLPVGIVIRMLQQRLAAAGAGQVDLGDLADGRLWPVGHHHHAVGQQDRFIHVMGDTDRGDFGAGPDFHQDLLQLPAGQTVKHAKGFVQQQ